MHCVSILIAICFLVSIFAILHQSQISSTLFEISYAQICNPFGESCNGSIPVTVIADKDMECNAMPMLIDTGNNGVHRFILNPEREACKAEVWRMINYNRQITSDLSGSLANCLKGYSAFSKGFCTPPQIISSIKCASGKSLDGTCVPVPCPAPRGVTYDKTKPNSDLSDPHVNPEMKFHLEEVLKKITADGGIKIPMSDGTDIIVTPRIHEAYRPPERADYLYEKHLNGGALAQPAGSTPHEYGTAVDVYLYDQNGRWINEKSKLYGKVNGANPHPTYPNTWHKFYEELAKYFIEEGFEWADKPSVGNPIGDAPHFEYHPEWKGLRGAGTLPGLRNSAMQEANQFGNPDGWLKIMWRNAGAECSP